MHPNEVKSLIEAGLTDAEVLVEGDGSHFTALVISPAFTGKSRLQNQQRVYHTVNAQLMDGSLHALSIKTLTPEEWIKLKQNKEENSWKD